MADANVGIDIKPVSEDATESEGLSQIRMQKSPGPLDEQAGHALHHYRDLGEQLAVDDGGAEAQTEMVDDETEPVSEGEDEDDGEDDNEPDLSVADLPERLGTYTVSEYGLGLYGNTHRFFELLDADRVTCIRRGQKRHIVPGVGATGPDFSVSDTRIMITGKGYEHLGLDPGDKVVAKRVDDEAVKLEYVGVDVTETDADLPDWIDEHPETIVGESPLDQSVEEVLREAETQEKKIDVHQRLRLNGINQTNRLLDELGLLTPSRHLHEDVEERVAALREVCDA